MGGEFGDLPIGADPAGVEQTALAATGKTREEREAETAALIARANDPDDPYDGHHGRDRTIVGEPS